MNRHDLLTLASYYFLCLFSSAYVIFLKNPFLYKKFSLPSVDNHEFGAIIFYWKQFTKKRFLNEPKRRRDDEKNHRIIYRTAESLPSV